MATVVFVHGFGCNSSAWGPVSREISLRGHRAVALDLPGHGAGARIPRSYLGTQDRAALAAEPSGMAGIGTADDVAAVTTALRRAREHGPVVLVGHSRGGLTLTAVANSVPELIDHLVYISAWCCVEETVGAYSLALEYAESRLGPIGGSARTGRPGRCRGDPPELAYRRP